MHHFICYKKTTGKHRKLYTAELSLLGMYKMYTHSHLTRIISGSHSSASDASLPGDSENLPSTLHNDSQTATLSQTNFRSFSK